MKNMILLGLSMIVLIGTISACRTNTKTTVSNTIIQSEEQQEDIIRLVYDYIGALDAKNFLEFISLSSSDALITNINIYRAYIDPKDKIKIKAIHSISCANKNGPCEVRLNLWTSRSGYGNIPLEYERARIVVGLNQQKKWVILVPPF